MNFKKYKMDRAKKKQLRKVKEELANLEYNEENQAKRMAMFQQLEKLL